MRLWRIIYLHFHRLQLHEMHFVRRVVRCISPWLHHMCVPPFYMKRKSTFFIFTQIEILMQGIFFDWQIFLSPFLVIPEHNFEVISFAKILYALTESIFDQLTFLKHFTSRKGNICKILCRKSSNLRKFLTTTDSNILYLGFFVVEWEGVREHTNNRTKTNLIGFEWMDGG